MNRWPFALIIAGSLGLLEMPQVKADSPLWPGNWFKSQEEEPVIHPYVAARPSQRATPVTAAAPRGVGTNVSPPTVAYPTVAHPSGAPQSTAAAPQKKKWGFLPVKLPFGKGGDEASENEAVLPVSMMQTGKLISQAESLEASGRMAEAQRAYEQALSHSPSDLDSLLGIAHLLDRQGQLEDACAFYERAAAAHPHSPKPVNDLGLCLARRGMLPEAAQTLSRATELNPNSALYRNNLATVLVEMGHADEAYQHLAAAHGPAAGHFNLAVLQQRRGNHDAAAAALQNAVAVDPGFGPATEWLAQLQQTPSAPPTQVTSASESAPVQGMQGPYGNCAVDGRVPPVFPPRDVRYPGCPPTPCVSPSYLEEICPVYPSTSNKVVLPAYTGQPVPQQPPGVINNPTPAPVTMDAPAAPAPAPDMVLQSPWPSTGAESIPASEASRYVPRRY